MSLKYEPSLEQLRQETDTRLQRMCEALPPGTLTMVLGVSEVLEEELVDITCLFLFQIA